MSRVHKAHELVAHLCAAWCGKDTAAIQASIIVRELCRAGMLVDSALCGLTVIEASGQVDGWWHPTPKPVPIVAAAQTDLRE